MSGDVYFRLKRGYFFATSLQIMFAGGHVCRSWESNCVKNILYWQDKVRAEPELSQWSCLIATRIILVCGGEFSLVTGETQIGE